MDFNSLFTKINKDNSFLVINGSLKFTILKIKSDYELKHKTLLKFKIITIDELIDLLSFSVDNEAYLNNLEKHERPLSLTKEMFMFSKYNLNNKNNVLNDFIAENANFITRNEFFLKRLNNISFYILGNEILLKPFIDHYSLNVQMINYQEDNQAKILKFLNKEEEVFYLFEEIAKLLDNKININNIYISNVSSSYYNFINKLSDFYQIPVNLNIRHSLINIPYIKELLNNDYEEIIKILTDVSYRNELFKDSRNKDKNEFDLNINKLINLFNKYYYEDYKEDVVLKIIKEDVSKLKVSDYAVINAVKVISLEEIIGLDKDDIVFVLNASYEFFPKIKKDNDYLSDDDKRIINYPTSSEINISNNAHLKDLLTLNNIRHISYSLKDNYLEYAPADIVNELTNTKHLQTTKMSLKNLNKAYAKDYYKSYFSKKKADNLLTSFTGEFKITSSQRKELIEYLKLKDLKISPSHVTNYYKIPFIYYLEQVIGLTTFKENINIVLGNFFHSLIEVVLVLFFEEKIYLDKKAERTFSRDADLHRKIFKYIVDNYESVNNFDYEKYFDDFYHIYFEKKIKEVKDYDLNNLSEENKMWIKTLFYTKKHQQILINALKLIIDLEHDIPSKELLIEDTISLDNLRGKADVVKIYDDNKYSIIDFKLGNRAAFHNEKIRDLVNDLLEEENKEVSFMALDLLQLVIYAYYFYKHRNDLKLKDLAYYSYFTKSLNALSTENLNSNYYTGGVDRYINEEELEVLFEKIGLLLNKTLDKINDFQFPIQIRRDEKTKEGMDKSYHSVYEALAFFNRNTLKSEDEDEN